MNRMHNGIDDNSKINGRVNHLLDGEDRIDVAQSQFLPSIELGNQEVGDEAMEKVLGNGINIEELFTYIEPAIVTENRNVNHSKIASMKGDTIKRILYPMKKCQPNDFLSKSFNMSADFEAKLNYRLCPNIPDNETSNYIIRNLY